MGVIQQDPTPDFNPDMLLMLTYLMLAQAQELVVVKSVIGKTMYIDLTFEYFIMFFKTMYRTFVSLLRCIGRHV